MSPTRGREERPPAQKERAHASRPGRGGTRLGTVSPGWSRGRGGASTNERREHTGAKPEAQRPGGTAEQPGDRETSTHQVRTQTRAGSGGAAQADEQRPRREELS